MKKGVSPVIAVILLIFIVVVIASIIAIFATGIVQNEKQKALFLASIKGLGLDIDKVYAKDSTTALLYGYSVLVPVNIVEVVVESSGNIDKEIVQTCKPEFTFYLNTGDTDTHISTETLPDIGMSKKYDINYNEIGNGITSESQIEKIAIRAKCPKGTSSVLDEETEIA